MRQLRGKWAFVTGAASGIGRAIALELAKEGVNLFLVDIDKERLDETITEISNRTDAVGSIALICDLSDANAISECVKSCLETGHGLDILVNCAGIAHYGPMLSMSAEQWSRLLAVNLHAPIQLTRELLPTLLARTESHVLNVSSMFGIVGHRRWVAYCTSKFGLLGFTEALRAEFSREGLGLTALCPGCVDTRFFESTECGNLNRKTPVPPRWLLATPERVAQKAVRAIRWNRFLVLVTPLAYLLYYGKRIIPWGFYITHDLDRPRTMRKKRDYLAAKRAAADQKVAS